MLRRDVADLVEEQRAAVGELEAAAARGLDGAGERALLVAEELREEQRLDEGRAVDRDEGARGALARPVDRLRHELLARAALAAHEHAAARGGDALDGQVKAADRGVVSDELPRRLAGRTTAVGRGEADHAHALEAHRGRRCGLVDQHP